MKPITFRLRTLRVARELSQRELAAKAKIPPGRYWFIENGHRDITEAEARKLAKVLRVEPETLLPVRLTLAVAGILSEAPE